MMNKTILGSIGIGAISLLYLWEASSLPVGSTAAPDIGYVPWLISWIAVVLCGLLAVNTWLTERSAAAEASREADQTEAAPGVGPGPWIIAASLLLYPVLLNFLGFFLGTLPLIYVSLLVMGYTRRLAGIGIAAVMTGVAYYLFVQWLGVQFPAGWFG